MKKFALVFISSMVLGVTACAPTQVSVTAPSLITPVSVKEDYAAVDRGTVQVIKQYKAITRVESTELYFEQTDLRFADYYVVAGQAVKEGELLARLDTEWIDEAIVDQEENMANIAKQNDFANQFSTLSIDTIRAEYVKLVRESGLDEESIAKAESKRLEIARAELALKQQKERQALTLKQEEGRLKELTGLIPLAELRAPFDGEITLVKEKFPGDAITPFDPLVFITDKQTHFLEVIDEGSVVSPKAVAKGYYEGKEYELERITLSKQEQLFYTTLRAASPVRFTILPGANEIPALGSFMTVTMFTSKVDDVLRVPINSLFNDPDLGSYVYVLQDGERVPVYIKTNLRNESYVEVTEGLSEGDRVYVRP